MEKDKYRLHTEEELKHIAETDFERFKEIAKYYYDNDFEFFETFFLPVLDKNKFKKPENLLNSIGSNQKDKTIKTTVVNCIHCNNKIVPLTREQISTAGWIGLIVLFITGFILLGVGIVFTNGNLSLYFIYGSFFLIVSGFCCLAITNKYHICPICKLRLD